MVVKEFKNARAFLDDYEAVLIEHEALGQLVLYWAYHYCDNEIHEKAFFGVVLEEKDVCLLFCNVSSDDLLIYAVDTDRIVPASIALADYFGNNHITIKGIIAAANVCQSFIEQLKQYVNCTFVEKMGMDIMELRQINEIKPVDGSHRLAQPEEAKLAAQWMVEFQMEALTSETDYEEALQKAVKQIEENQIYFYEDIDHNVVSMAVASRKLAHGTTITYIYTPEEYRGKGYAAANIYYLSKELLEQGNEFCTLIIDKKNPLSNRAYEKVGYKVIGDSYEYSAVPNKI